MGNLGDFVKKMSPVKEFMYGKGNNLSLSKIDEEESSYDDLEGLDKELLETLKRNGTKIEYNEKGRNFKYLIIQIKKLIFFKGKRGYMNQRKVVEWRVSRVID